MLESTKYKMKATARKVGELYYKDFTDHGLQVLFLNKDKTEYGSRWVISIKNQSNEVFEGIIHAEVCFVPVNPKFFMPAFLYNKNRGDVSPYLNQNREYVPFPRLGINCQLKGGSDFWMVRSDRLSHPVSIAFDQGMIYGISAAPLNGEKSIFNGFSCRIGKDECAVGFTLGYENSPWLYVSSHDPLIKSENICDSSILLNPGETKEVSLYVICMKADYECDVNSVIRYVYDMYHQLPRQGSSVFDTVQDISQAIYKDAYVEKVKTYSTRVFLKNNIVEQEPLASISWTGGVEVAAPMLYAAARLHDYNMREQAIQVVENIVQNSINLKSGLPFDAYDETHWYTKGWWDASLSQSGHSSYLIGQALYYILQAYFVEKTYFNCEHMEWLNYVKKCLDIIESTKNAQGEVPHLWSEDDGTALEYDSFSGCWCVAAALYLDKLSEKTDYLMGSIKSIRHYYNTYVSKMECYGTPHDTLKAVDSEGILAFIKSARLLHELTGKKEYINMLSDGLEYEFTFKFCWNPPIQVEPLKRIGWSCCGGSVTSTCNPHIHPMSNNVTDEILYCYQQTNDIYFKNRLEDTVKWALQTYSTYDGEYDYGKKGWMSERFCYSQGLLNETYDNGELCSTWRCFLPWGASNILEGLCGLVWENIVNK